MAKAWQKPGPLILYKKTPLPADMKITPTEIPDVKMILPVAFKDDRGSFSETYRRDLLEKAGVVIPFTQDNRSVSTRKYTIRGMHYQLPPMAQAKLVAVVKGRILDIAVDIRRGSPSFGKHIARELSAEGGEQLLIPAGFAHGFCTLEDDTIVTYKVDNPYAPQQERGLHWRSPDLNIDWPCTAEQATLSPKDAKLPEAIDPAACF
jgi:dTDP-4-dehydrorhamnose 3,5-epimerase